MPNQCVFFVVVLTLAHSFAEEDNQPSISPPRAPVASSYGLDVSFPIHHTLQTGTFQHKRYNEYMEGCYKRYSKGSCDSNERARKQLNLRQPKTQFNYTEKGFQKVVVPDETWVHIKSFWEKHKDSEEAEEWPAGNTYTNHWVNPTYMVSLENAKFREGRRLKQKIWDGIKPILEEWTGQLLRPTSLYGIRVYKEAAMLASHVDRLPLVTSAIINVDQDLDEPWPVEVYTHDGDAHNVTMKPQDLVLYESHTVVHGRPTPLKGRFYANIFVHFMPVDENGNDLNGGSSESLSFPDSKKKVRGAKTPLVGGHEQLQHSVKDVRKHEKIHEDDDERVEWEESMFSTGSTPLHMAAALGDINKVMKIIEDGNEVSIPDQNNWHPIHEAARSGHLNVVQELVEAGADLGVKTHRGGTALWLARELHGDAHPVVSFLSSIGAPDMGADEL